ncbi:hypothetical protein BDU57DRAFT_575095 [Ampelomyces quisqualis]|uniref:Uncharacterized protein n=1 Tax=Ampelomyces quisqualis TaxID=50730 RepID=A0A6A5QQ41_AMPQU|nr:hypothetical protein BDU57DRAFT_575095 [Ampelomyces quisqualis]
MAKRGSSRDVVVNCAVSGVSAKHVAQDITDARNLGLSGFTLNYGDHDTPPTLIEYSTHKSYFQVRNLKSGKRILLLPAATTSQRLSRRNSNPATTTCSSLQATTKPIPAQPSSTPGPPSTTSLTGTPGNSPRQGTRLYDQRPNYQTATKKYTARLYNKHALTNPSPLSPSPNSHRRRPRRLRPRRPPSQPHPTTLLNRRVGRDQYLAQATTPTDKRRHEQM